MTDGTTWLSADALVPVVSSALTGLLAVVGVLLASSGERSLRRRIARDVETWEKLPRGSQPRAQLFRVIGYQVDALVRPDEREALLNNRSRYLAALAVVLGCSGLGFVIERVETPRSWPYQLGTAEVAIAMCLAVWAALTAGQSYVLRYRRRRTGA